MELNSSLNSAIFMKIKVGLGLTEGQRVDFQVLLFDLLQLQTGGPMPNILCAISQAIEMQSLDI